MAYPPQMPFYAPTAPVVMDPRLRNWSSWGDDARPRGSDVGVVDPSETPALPPQRLDLFPDESHDGRNPSFAPPTAVIHHSHGQDSLWANPHSRPDSRNADLYSQPIAHWPVDIVNQYSEIAGNPTTFTLPYGHRQPAVYTPAHMMPKGVHIESSIAHNHGGGLPPPPPMSMPPLMHPPGMPGLDLIPAMESLALVPAYAPARPVELYRNNINSIPRPPSAPPAFHSDDIGPYPPSAMPAMAPMPPAGMYSMTPGPMPSSGQHYDHSQYMTSAPPQHQAAATPQPPPATIRSYSNAYTSGNHINRGAARAPSPLPPAPPRAVTPKYGHSADDAFYARPQFAHKPQSSSSGQSSSGRPVSDKPLKGILQRTQYEEPAGASWAGLWNAPDSVPVIPPPLAPYDKVYDKPHKAPAFTGGRRRGNSVHAFTPASHQPGLHHGYPASAVGAMPSHKHSQSQTRVSPQDQLDALLANSFTPDQPTGTHPFFNEFAATPAKHHKSAGAMGTGGYPWHTTQVMATPSSQLGNTYVSGLFAEDMQGPGTGKPKGGKGAGAGKENNLHRSNTFSYGTQPKTYPEPPAPPAKDPKHNKVAPVISAEALYDDMPPLSMAEQSWYTTSAPTPAPTGKNKKSKHAQPVTPAPHVIHPTPILQKPNEASQYYGLAVKFADDTVGKKKNKR